MGVRLAKPRVVVPACRSATRLRCRSGSARRFIAIAGDPAPRGKTARYAGLARRLGDRLGPLLSVLLGARGSDLELDDFARTIDGERLAGAAGFVAHLAVQGLLWGDLERDSAP